MIAVLATAPGAWTLNINDRHRFLIRWKGKDVPSAMHLVAVRAWRLGRLRVGYWSRGTPVLRKCSPPRPRPVCRC
jgi:hypothetical protein